ncbi:MAG: DUF4368 domain-containing protein [Clostridia bacterium]|nr:DUF4368 domain-containing protein [Clostridia bacterium]
MRNTFQMSVALLLFFWNVLNYRCLIAFTQKYDYFTSNDFDIVAVQEDFGYHNTLVENMNGFNHKTHHAGSIPGGEGSAAARTSQFKQLAAFIEARSAEHDRPVTVNELIEKIEVHSIEGKGKNKTQKIIIHYRFVGVIENPVKEENIILEERQGVAVEYLTA